MGQTDCRSEHDFSVIRLGAGMARLACRRCGAVVIDVDAAEDGSAAVTEPGLFGPAKPTIFSVLAEERREMEKVVEEQRRPAGSRGGPVFAFGGTVRRR